MSDEKPIPGASSKERLLEALIPRPVFDFASHSVGTIHVASMRANTLEKIVFEFEKSDANDNFTLRRLLREIGQTENEGGLLEPIPKDRVAEVTDDEAPEGLRLTLERVDEVPVVDAAAAPLARVRDSRRTMHERAG
jgi:hypothetical protein